KLAESIKGRPLLEHAIEAVRPFASQIVVVGPPGGNVATPDGVTLVRDKIPFEGPLAGLITGLGAVVEPIVLVIGGDMPSLVDSVVESMVGALASGVDAA